MVKDLCEIRGTEDQHRFGLGEKSTQEQIYSRKNEFSRRLLRYRQIAVVCGECLSRRVQ